MRRRGIGRAGRPSLVGTVARTAVVAGTASAVSGSVTRSQQARADEAAVAQQNTAAQQPPQPAAPSAPAATPAGLPEDAFEQLKKLGELREAGILTEDEFAAAKAKILGG